MGRILFLRPLQPGTPSAGRSRSYASVAIAVELEVEVKNLRNLGSPREEFVASEEQELELL